MKRALTASVFIPALNEEANIENLIHSLFRQKQETFKLEKVVVLSDGSTDNTARIVKKLSKQYPHLLLIDDHKQRGVTYRLNQMMILNTSDVAICLDGDILPANENVLEYLLQPFRNRSVQLATAKLAPIPPETRFEKLLFAWRQVWATITHSWKNGNNIYNFRGAGLAMSKKFTEKIHLPNTIVGANSHYLYLYAKQHSIPTAFCGNAILHYRLATSLKDYLLQTNRGQGDNQLLRILFPDTYAMEYKIPSQLRILYVGKSFMNHPIQTLLGLLFNAIIPFLNKEKVPSDYNGAWQTARSTKKLSINNYAP